MEDRIQIKIQNNPTANLGIIAACSSLEAQRDDGQD